MEHNSFLERYLTPIAVLLGAVILAAAYVFGGGGTLNTGGNPQAGGQPAAVAVDIKNVKTAGDPYVGDVNAPVTMAFWFDYQCPFCKLFETNVTAKLYTDYVQTGKLRIIFKDFQFLGQDSNDAALFARAVWELYPDKFYVWYQAMFVAQDDEGDRGFGDLASIQVVSKTIPGIDVDKVTALMNQKKSTYEAAIAANRAEGASLGVNGTPATIVGKQLLSGAQPYETVKAAVDAELK
jgi:protein-disulfide isomerase